MTSFTETVFLILCIICCNVSFAQEATNVFRASIPENKESGFLIGNLATETQVLQNATESQKDGARFTYLKDSANNIYFALNYVTGDLNTSKTIINREKICEFSATCEITLEIAVTSGKFFDIVTAKITILDENDNAPTFSYKITKFEISESESVGTELIVGTAFDADMSGNNSIQDYTIEQPIELFELIATKGDDSSYSFRLKLLQTLDREREARYNVKLIVSDGGTPVLSATLDITVNVLDENDNAPEFLSNVYNKTIDENIPINSVVLTISATDKDIGENGRVSYRIRERQSNVDTIKRLFKLDGNSGELTVISDLTSEPAEHYEFVVEATDNGSVASVNQTLVIITVNDAENNPPTIEINLLSPGNIGFVDIEENQPTEVFVAHVNVEDYDKGDNGKFTCDIKNSLFTLEKFQGRGFKVVVDGLLDREEKEIHTVKVECEDLGNPPESSSKTFSVRVLDVNDNDPKFEKEIYTAIIAENNQIGANITRVKATDIDQGLNGTVEYMLFKSDGRFSINNVTGHIYANTSFDRELERNLIIFRVLAVDHGPSRRTATTTVSLTLTDINDNTPVMIPARPEMRIAENQAPKTSLGFLQAKDNDLGVNGMVTFTITPVKQTSFPFTLSREGELKTTEVLDREQQSRYEIPVTVTDLGAKQLSNTQYVTVYVTDENDNSPKVTFPNDTNDTVKFVYPVDAYNVVTNVAAYDVDDGENGSLSYQIIGGNELDIFEIDSELGEISIKKFIDIKEDMIISLTIEVKDKAIVPKSTNVTLNIALIYANSTSGALREGEAGNKYIIISVIVIVTTIAVAVAIVAVILFLRSVDNKKTREDESARYSDSGISSNADSIPQDGYLPGEEKSKKKKEVSFSLEFSLGGLDGGRNIESSTDEYSRNRFYDSPPTTLQHGPPTYSVQNQERIDGHMKALKLQQYLWEAKSRDWENSPVHQLPVGDSESETSRETVTCDSGRGGSEDDVSMSSPVAEEKRFFSIQDPKPKHVQFLPQQKFVHTSLPAVRESTPVQHSQPPRPPPPVSYRPSSQTDLQNNAHRNNPRLAIKNFTNPTYSSNHAHNQQINQRNSYPQSEAWREYYHQNGGKYYPRMRHDSGSSLRSNEDDGGSTTTSGSYTLDEQDIDVVDMYPNQRDLVV